MQYQNELILIYAIHNKKNNNLIFENYNIQKIELFLLRLEIIC